MKIIYKSLATAIFILSSSFLANAADEQQKLVVMSKSGVATEFDISKIGKVTLDNNNLTIIMADGSKETLNIKDIDKLTFDAEISDSGVEMVEARAGADLHITVENNLMRFTERNDKDINVTVYSSNGAQVLKSKGVGTVQVDFNGMSSGVYIITANDKVIKYIR